MKPWESCWEKLLSTSSTRVAQRRRKEALAQPRLNGRASLCGAAAGTVAVGAEAAAAGSDGVHACACVCVVRVRDSACARVCAGVSARARASSM